MLPASLCAKIMVFRRITRIIEVVLNERAVMVNIPITWCFQVFMTFISMKVISLNLILFLTIKLIQEIIN